MAKSLGLIEVYGLAPAILIADAMAKVASVQLLPMDYSIGAGCVQIRVTGDVASVQAAVATGRQMAQTQKCYRGHTVLARAAEQVYDALAANTVLTVDPAAEDKPLANNNTAEDVTSEHSDTGAACNICNDPACGRIKGEPRSTCIHYVRFADSGEA